LLDFSFCPSFYFICLKLHYTAGVRRIGACACAGHGTDNGLKAQDRRNNLTARAFNGCTGKTSPEQSADKPAAEDRG
jgi:hypothetical protein